jgi:hypothetical protein
MVRGLLREMDGGESMQLKIAIAGVIALGLAVTEVAMARGGKLSHGKWEGAWDDGDDGGGFSTGSVHGTYALRFSGFQNGTGSNPSAPTNGLAILTFDGNGNVTGTETTNTLLNSGMGIGVVCSGTLGGTPPNYTVNPDGSGSATLQLTLNGGSDPACGTSPINNDFNFVIVDRHHLAISSSDNTGSWGGDANARDDD